MVVFRKDQSISLRGTSSCLTNNLSIFYDQMKGLCSYAIIHKSIVLLVVQNPDGTIANHRQITVKEQSGQGMAINVIQAKWVSLPNRMILVITTDSSIQFYEPDGSAIISVFPLPVAEDSEAVATYARGIAGVGKNLVLVGLYDGSILLFEVPSKGTNLNHIGSVKGHASGITDMISDEALVASADGTGAINIWSYEGDKKLKLVTEISGAGFICSSLEVWNGVLIAGYGNGVIQFYSMRTGRIMAEIAAHGKCINAIDVAPETGLLVSASADTFARVFKLNKKNDTLQIQHIHNELVKDNQLTGAKFRDPEGRTLCLTSFDLNEILCFVQS